MHRSIFFTIRYLLFTIHFAPTAWAQDLRDVRPPVDLLPNYFWFWILAAALTAGISAAALFWLNKRNSRLAGKNVVVKAAWEIASEELDALAKENLPAQGRVKEYYVRLSQIVRRYMEGRFAIQAPEMTTEEFLLSLRNAPELIDRHRQAMREFLNCSDMVKFAKYGASVAEMEQGFTLAKRLVEETKIQK